MELRLAFCQTFNEQLLVNCEVIQDRMNAGASTFSVTAFQNENEFIQRAALAELPNEDTVKLVAAVLKTISEKTCGLTWVRLTTTPRQWALLGLGAAESDPVDACENAEAIDLHDVLMQTPMPFALLTGPEHRFSFINQSYVALLRRSSASQLLGKPIREAVPEMKGQPFHNLLDRVYRTGEPYIGHEVAGSLRNDISGKTESGYFDFIYYPVRNREDEVCGIMAQATDVSERVLAQQVSESREEQLYRQWLELDTIYRNSPMGMCLLDADGYRILRLNAIQAEMMDTTVEKALGRPYMEAVSERCPLRPVYERVVTGEEICNHEIHLEVPRGSGVIRTWLVTCSPLFNETGRVEIISSISVEITDRLDMRTNEGANLPPALIEG